MYHKFYNQSKGVTSNFSDSFSTMININCICALVAMTSQMLFLKLLPIYYTMKSIFIPEFVDHKEKSEEETEQIYFHTMVIICKQKIKLCIQQDVAP